MKKQIQLTDKTLLVVSVPKEAIDIYVEGLRLFYTENKNTIDEVITAVYIGERQLLGIYPELTEEQAQQIICDITFRDYSVKPHENTFYNMYPNFKTEVKSKKHCFATAKESFQSLMERENITGFDKYAILIKSK